MNNDTKQAVIRNLLHQIVNLLVQQSSAYPGLLIGNAGMVLFLSRYYKFIKQEDGLLAKINSLMEDIFSQVAELELNSSLASGYAGLHFLLKHLIELDLLEPTDYKDSLEELEQIILQSALDDIVRDNFDPLYGFIGKINQLKPVSPLPAALKNWMHSLIQDVSFSRITDQGVIQLGLAHGLSAVLLFALRLGRTDLDKKVIDELFSIYKSIAGTTRGGCSVFPTGISPDLTMREVDESRYAWCNGDLGILYSLACLSLRFDDDQFEILVRRMVEACNKRTVANAGVHFIEATGTYDIGFCHGLCGIYYLQKKINVMMADEVLHSNEYWLELLLSETGTWLHLLSVDPANENFNMFDVFGLLEGLSGVGLVLIDEISPEAAAVAWCPLI